MSENIVHKADQMPAKYKQAYLKTISGEASPREAIKAFCLECMAYVRTEVRDCRSFACPLNRYRPYVDFSKEDTGG